MADKNQCVVKFRLGKILRERGLTQIAASEATGLSRQALIKLVRDPQAVQFETLSKLCQGLGLQPKELFEVE